MEIGKKMTEIEIRPEQEPIPEKPTVPTPIPEHEPEPMEQPA